MILIIGPAYSGKSAYAKMLAQQKNRGDGPCVLLTEVQEQVLGQMDEAALQALADSLCRQAQIMTASETGAGIVPMDGPLRLLREKQGNLLSILAQRAECVVRVFYGIPEVIKGKKPGEAGG
jgi:adenosyl cobinamide kinase/adenosyl cobinamide phosphate guanylyltransferase